MPSFNITIEDNSPVIIYSSQWVAGTSGNDPSADSYSQSSFMVSSHQGDTLSFTYYGTSVQFFGAERTGHGPYHVDVDGPGSVSFDGNGNGGNTSTFGVALFPPGATLQEGMHTMTVTNKANSFLDVDFITWQTSVGNEDEDVIVNTFQDTHSSFVYSPSSSWTTNPKNVGLFSGGSGHVTTLSGASVEFTFEVRDAIALYGPVDPNGASYSVQLDGGAATNYTTNRGFYRPQLMMYQASHLGAGTHTLKIQYGSSTNGQALAIDYANVYTTASLQGSSAKSDSGKLSGGDIAGIVLSVLLLVFALLGLFYFFVLRRRRLLFGKKQSYPEKIVDIEGTQAPGVTPVVEPFTYRTSWNQQSQQSQANWSNVPSASEGNQFRTSFPSSTVTSQDSHYGQMQRGRSLRVQIPQFQEGSSSMAGQQEAGRARVTGYPEQRKAREAQAEGAATSPEVAPPPEYSRDPEDRL